MLKERYVKKTIRVCDECEIHEAKEYYCCLCGKSICEKCVEKINPLVASIDDYHYYCHSCAIAGEKFRLRMEQLKFQFEDRMEALENGWKRVAMRKALREMKKKC